MNISYYEKKIKEEVSEILFELVENEGVIPAKVEIKLAHMEDYPFYYIEEVKL